MKIVIIGAGGVGGYFGGRLIEAGKDVTLIARGAHYEAIQLRGLEVKSIKGDFKVTPKISNNLSPVEQADLVALQVAKPARLLASSRSEHTDVNLVIHPGPVGRAQGQTHRRETAVQRFHD